MTTRTVGNWIICVTPEPGKPTYRLRAMTLDGQRAIHTDRLTLAEAESFNPDADWAFATRKFEATR